MAARKAAVKTKERELPEPGGAYSYWRHIGDLLTLAKDTEWDPESLSSQPRCNDETLEHAANETNTLLTGLFISVCDLGQVGVYTDHSEVEKAQEGFMETFEMLGSLGMALMDAQRVFEGALAARKAGQYVWAGGSKS